MTPEEIEELWCGPCSPVIRAWFDDQSGFANFILLMADGSVSAQIDSSVATSAQVLVDAIVHFNS